MVDKNREWYNEMIKSYKESGVVEEFYAELFMGVSNETDELAMEGDSK